MNMSTKNFSPQKVVLYKKNMKCKKRAAYVKNLRNFMYFISYNFLLQMFF